VLRIYTENPEGLGVSVEEYPGMNAK